MADDEYDDEARGSPPLARPALSANSAREQRYLNLFITAVRTCARYRPMFGRGEREGLTLQQFQQAYGSDPFYPWIGLDSPLVYAAHRAAGGMTSIYRQLGIAVEWILRAILQDSLGLSDEQVAWSYELPAAEGGSRLLTLDARIHSF